MDEYFEKLGYKWIPEYIKMFPNSPILMWCIGRESCDRMEEIAEKCVKAGKTSEEMGFIKRGVAY